MLIPTRVGGTLVDRAVEPAEFYDLGCVPQSPFGSESYHLEQSEDLLVDWWQEITIPSSIDELASDANNTFASAVVAKP
jgi:hypothetical protein